MGSGTVGTTGFLAGVAPPDNGKGGGAGMPIIGENFKKNFFG